MVLSPPDAAPGEAPDAGPGQAPDAASTARRAARLGALAIAVAACTWGFWGLAIRRSGLSGPHVPCIVLATVALFGLPLLPRRLPRDLACWGALFATGVCDAGNALLYFESLARGPQPVAVLSHYLAPILVAVFTPWLLHTRTPRITWLALPISLGGLAFLLGPEALSLGRAATTAALGAGSAIFFALQVLIQKRFSGRLTAGELLVWHSAFSAILLLPFAVGQMRPEVTSLLWLMGGGIAGGCFAGTLFLWGLTRVTAGTAAVLTYVEPLTGVIVGVTLLGESMPVLAPVGAVLIVGAGLAVVRSPESPRA